MYRPSVSRIYLEYDEYDHWDEEDYYEDVIRWSILFKVRMFWEDHKILLNLLLTYVYSKYRQNLGGDFAKFCGLLRIYEL